MFSHTNINYYPVFSRSLAGYGIDLGKETKRAESFGSRGDFSRIERVAFNHAEFAPDNPVKRCRVALDVDPFNKYSRTANQRKFKIQPAFAVISRDPQLNSNKTQRQIGGQLFQPVDVAVQ